MTTYVKGDVPTREDRIREFVLDHMLSNRPMAKILPYEVWHAVVDWADGCPDSDATSDHVANSTPEAFDNMCNAIIRHYRGLGKCPITNAGCPFAGECTISAQQPTCPMKI